MFTGVSGGKLERVFHDRKEDRRGQKDFQYEKKKKSLEGKARQNV